MSNELIEKQKETIALVDPDTTKQEELELEIEEVKAGLQAIAETGTKAIEELAGLAKAGQHPRLYEALANSIKAVNETHRELNSILKTKKEFLDSTKQAGMTENTPQTVNNNLYVSSTEFLQMVKDKVKNGSKE